MMLQFQLWCKMSVMSVVIVMSGACGVVHPERNVFPNQLVATDGTPLVIEDVLEITGDEDLSDEEKADALRALGLENEEVIDTIIQGGLIASPGEADGLVKLMGAG